MLVELLSRFSDELHENEHNIVTNEQRAKRAANFLRRPFGKRAFQFFSH